MKNRLLLFTGFPGVGKSTISQGVGQRTGATIVDLDDFKKTDVDPLQVKHEIDPPDVRWAYYQKALECVFDKFDQGLRMAIMDEVFHLRSLRDQLESRCANREVQAIWIEVQCPYAVVRKRLESTTRPGHILTTEEALNMYLRFQDIFEAFPANSKNRIVVNNEHDTDINLLVERILSYG
jgi:predicted kinase